jgi:hypothetical protein
VRANTTLQVGQVWESNDRRRPPFTFRIAAITSTSVTIDVVYPERIAQRTRTLPRDAFRVTGFRGYSRVS